MKREDKLKRELFIINNEFNTKYSEISSGFGVDYLRGCQAIDGLRIDQYHRNAEMITKIFEEKVTVK